MFQRMKNEECFKDIKLTKSQRQPSSLKILLTGAIYANKKEHCSNKRTKTRSACCDYIKKGSFHSFKTAGDILYIKEDMKCESSNLIYVVTCSTCNEEYIGETGEGKTRFRDRVRVYGRHTRQLQYQYLNCEEHFRTRGKEEFKTFAFFTLHSKNKYLNKNSMKSIFEIYLNHCCTSNLK